MKKVILGVTFVLVTCMLATGAFAYGSKKDKGKQCSLADKFSKTAHLVFGNKEDLGVSDEQLGKIKDLKISTLKDLIRKKADIEIMALDIKAELWEDSINIDLINKLIDQKYDIKKSKTKALVASYAKLKKLLTEEQTTKLKALCKQQCKQQCK